MNFMRGDRSDQILSALVVSFNALSFLIFRGVVKDHSAGLEVLYFWMILCVVTFVTLYILRENRTINYETKFRKVALFLLTPFPVIIFVILARICGFSLGS